jgi:hypothetical protein
MQHPHRKSRSRDECQNDEERDERFHLLEPVKTVSWPPKATKSKTRNKKFARSLLQKKSYLAALEDLELNLKCAERTANLGKIEEKFFREFASNTNLRASFDIDFSDDQTRNLMHSPFTDTTELINVQAKRTYGTTRTDFTTDENIIHSHSSSAFSDLNENYFENDDTREDNIFGLPIANQHYSMNDPNYSCNLTGINEFRQNLEKNLFPDDLDWHSDILPTFGN